MKKIIVLIIVFLFLAFCNACTVTVETKTVSADVVQTSTSVQPTEIPATLTAIPSATPTLTSTPEPAFKGGIPERIEQCNHLEIYNPSGTLDPALIESQMQQLVEAEKKYIQEKGLGAKDISEIITNYTVTEPTRLPYAYARGEGHLIPVSCALVPIPDGSWRLMVGVIFKQDYQATTISVVHFLLDHPGLEKYMTAEGELEYYQAKNTPEATFDALRKGPRWFFEIKLWIPGENTNPKFFADWQVSHDLVELNQDAPIYLNMYLSGTMMDPAMKGGFVPLVEKMIFPAMRVQVTALP